MGQELCVNATAYLANSFPEAGEPYVWEEIRELRRHGHQIVCCSFRQPRHIREELAALANETLYVPPPCGSNAFVALFLFATKFRLISDLVGRIVRGPEPLTKRLRALVHTCLGAWLAATLRRHKVEHIHVHHGYFSAWAGMVAARFLGATFSITLHGSDLLVRADYLDCKLKECSFCVAVSEFNRNYIYERYPQADRSKVVVHRLGVDLDLWRVRAGKSQSDKFSILSVGRLHPVKNFDFLVRACRSLKSAGVDFRCVIAGEGEERKKLEQLIRELGLQSQIELLGHVPREQLPELYSGADVVVLTSRSEGIPLTLMEAMATGCVVLAPAITGIPELVAPRRTGFLYQPDSMEDFLGNLEEIRRRSGSLTWLRHAAREHVETNFDRERNLAIFADDFLRRVDAAGLAAERTYEDSLLQQIQLPVQRDRSLPF
jgi:glycosyltransferase involved in cell wall biosynthesis